MEYKALDIPFPPLSRGSQATEPLRMALWAIPESAAMSRITDASSFLYVDLALRDFGALPFPVLSLPIMFTSSSNRTSKVKAMKQEQIERMLLFSGPSDSDAPYEHRSLIIREQTSFDLDKVNSSSFYLMFLCSESATQKVWDSGLGLSSWLSNQLCPGSEPDSTLNIVDVFRRHMLSPEALEIVELGM